MRKSPLLAPAFLLSLAAPFPSSPQNLILDEGAFRVIVHGQTAGREEFSVRRAGPGAQDRVMLGGTVTLDLPSGRRSLAPALEAEGPEMEVSAYQIKISGSESSEIYVTRTGRRFLARVLSHRGEELREFRAGPGSVLLDEEVAHHYYLLAPFLERGPAISLTVLSPRAGRQERMTLSPGGVEEIRVGNSLVMARRFRLEAGQASRDLWFDDRGRVLRVEVPSLGYLAEREVLP